MAALIPSASATGSGTMTLAGPSTNSNQTITIPDATGTMMVSGNMPAFRAYLSSNQTVTLNTSTKVQLNTENFDTANCFDSTTNYRFTPNVAGYYQFSAVLALSGTSITNGQAQIYKNGTTSSEFIFYSPSASTLNQINATLTNLIYMNGSTDYVELYGYISATGTLTFNGGERQAYLAGYLARSA
jgi:hypothetical protein